MVLLVPAVNYWWPSLPADISESAFKKLELLYQTSFWVAHNLPFLFCGWMKQNLFGSSPTITESRVQETTSKPDLEITEQQQRPLYGGSDAVCFLLFLSPFFFRKIIISSISPLHQLFNVCYIAINVDLLWGKLTNMAVQFISFSPFDK